MTTLNIPPPSRRPSEHMYYSMTKSLCGVCKKAVDAKIVAGEHPGVLAGVPIGIKDLVATKDILTVMGSPWYRDFVPDEDAESVRPGPTASRRDGAGRWPGAR